LQRILTIISDCKTAAYELFQYLHVTHWKYLKKWVLSIEKRLNKIDLKSQTKSDLQQSRRILLNIIEKLISIAQSDFLEKKIETEKINSTGCCCSPKHNSRLFSKYDLVNLVTSSGLQDFIAMSARCLREDKEEITLSVDRRCF